MQAELFALDVITEERASGTADLKLTGYASDNFKYAIKTQQDHPDLPASEWFCYKLSERVHLPTPVCRVLRMRDGSLAFGSRWENAAYQFSTILDKDGGPAALMLLAAKNLSSIIGLDYFLPNPDRHLNNLLFQSFEHHVAAISFDFSRAWLMGGFPAADCKLSPNSRTSLTLRLMRTQNAFIITEAEATLKKVLQIKGSVVKDMFKDMPASWLALDRVDEFVDWWDSAARADRLDQALQVLAA